MSRINDALKQARQAQPRTGTNVFPPQHMAKEDRTSPLVWLIPSLIIFLIIAGIFVMSWAAAHRTVNAIVGDSETTNHPPVVVDVPVPVITPPPPVVEPEPVDLPVLQGIFYSATAPTAIIDNKNVSPGDRIKQYRVKQITKNTVILTDPDGKDLKLGMSQ